MALGSVIWLDNSVPIWFCFNDVINSVHKEITYFIETVYTPVPYDIMLQGAHNLCTYTLGAVFSKVYATTVYSNNPSLVWYILVSHLLASKYSCTQISTL